MSFKPVREEGPLRLSYSSAQQVITCEQKYVYRKVLDVKPDTEQDTIHFDIGKAVHSILELTFWSNTDLSLHFKNVCDHYAFEDETRFKIYAMVCKMLALHKASNLEVVAIEVKLETDQFLGYVDAIMKDEEGGWYIVDLKTAASLQSDLKSRLPMDTQLNLYSYFADEIMKRFDLNPEGFLGCLYRVVTKSKLKRRKTEEVKDYTKRVYENIDAVEYFIPVSSMNPRQFMAQQMALRGTAELLQTVREGEPWIPRRNYASCFSYFRPCEYWSQCHGSKYEESGDVIVERRKDDF